MNTSQQQAFDALSHWARREVSGLDLSNQIISRLVKNDRVCSLTDLYGLKEEDFQNLEKIKRDQVLDVLERIAGNGSISLSKALYGLNIPGVGVRQADRLAAHYGSYERFYTEAFRNGLLDEVVFREIVGDAALLLDIDNWYNAGGDQLMDDVYELTTGHPPKLRILPHDQRSLVGKRVFMKGHFGHLTQAQIREHLDALGSEVLDNFIEADVVLLGNRHGVTQSAISEDVVIYHWEDTDIENMLLDHPAQSY